MLRVASHWSFQRLIARVLAIVLVMSTGLPTVVALTAPAVAPPDAIAAQDANSVQPGWLAYLGEDGNVLLARPDGSDQRAVTADATAETPNGRPRWSHDGAMLVFTGPAGGLHIVREGVVSALPGTESCWAPAFAPANDRVIALCEAVEGVSVASISLDGADVVEILGNVEGAPVDLDVRAGDGMVMVVTDDGTRRMFDAAFMEVASFTVTEAYGDPTVRDVGLAKFSPVDGEILAVVCVAGCDDPAQVVHLGITASDAGVPLLLWSPGQAGQRGRGMDLAPDGSRGVMAYEDASGGSQLGVMPAAGTWSPIGVGSDPVWQPVPVELNLEGEAVVEESPVIESVESEADDVADIGASPAAEAGSAGWIAYSRPIVGEEGVILIRPDASEQIRISDFAGYNISWSHDGTMLAFNGLAGGYQQEGPQGGIWLYRDGILSELPGAEGCTMPAFTADNLRVLYVCPDEAHQDVPAGSVFPDDMVGTSALAYYFPLMSYLGTIRSSALDGSDVRVEYELTPEDLVTVWGDPTHAVMVVRIHVSPVDGTIMVVFADEVYRPSSAGGVVFDANFDIVRSIILDENGVIPTMHPDGSIIQIAHCPEGGCPDGTSFQLFDVDGNPVDHPLYEASMSGAWTSELSPAGDAVLNWNYYDGVWIANADGGIVTLDPASSSTAPRWQPVPAEIIPPAA